MVRDAVVRTDCRAIAIMFVRPFNPMTVCPSGTDVHCVNTVHFNTDLCLRLYIAMFWGGTRGYHTGMETNVARLPRGWNKIVWDSRRKRGGLMTYKLGEALNVSNDKQVVRACCCRDSARCG